MNTPDGSKKQARALTTTSYAVLAALALREHSTYELAKQMRMGWRYFWPRAESNVYAEPKRLVEAGLAESRKETTGRRPRTVYAITEAGRAALTAWVTSPSTPQRYESEAVLKVFFAEHGSVDDLLVSVRALRDEALAGIEQFRRIAELYANGEGQYPDRFALSALVARLLGEQHAATVRWAEWAERVVSSWSTPLDADADWGVDAVRGIAGLRGDATVSAVLDPVRGAASSK
jgi:PadR family transcriptional regulator, regulatory protein AphA